MADILTTGATGFLGTNITRLLVNSGYSVRAFGLPGSATKYIQSPKVEIMEGDITDVASVDKAVTDTDAIIHVAGDTGFWKKRFESQRRVNVEGTRNIMESAKNHGIGKVVHTSTVDTFGYNPTGLMDESWPEYNYGRWGYNYADTKREGEKIVMEYAAGGLDVTIINPGSMIGPFDHTLQFGRLFMDIRDKNVPGIPCGGAPWALVEEVAKAHIVALEKGKPGEKYICGGVNEPYSTVFAEIASSINVSPPKMVLPRWIAVAYGYFAEFQSNFTRKPPDLNPGQARYMSIFPKCDSSKAERELGFQCRSLRKMVEDARDWYRSEGFL
ncbi:MAG: NAD-dependent epimerase/dehydratase family protein [Promethearchaeota archaeon]